jgi:transposase
MRHELNKTLTKNVFKIVGGSSSRERLLHRLHSVVLVLNGLSASKVARMYKDSPRAVAYWVSRFKRHGIEGLHEEVRPGRPSRLNTTQWKKVQTFMNQSRAKQKPLSGDTLCAFLLAEFEIALTPRQCWRILKRLRT